MNNEKIVSVKDLNHSYGPREEQRVLSRISFDIHAGEIVLLTGASGSGKTTLASLIGALRRPQEGSLKVFGSELLNADESSLLRTRKQIGYIFQQHNLLSFLSAKQNVQLPMQLHSQIGVLRSESDALNMLELVGLSNRANYYPYQLSGGQKQRVAVARALVMNPKLVIADEPTASLDSKSGVDVINLLTELAEKSKTSVILVTHDTRLASKANRLLHLEDGVLSTHPTYPQLKKVASISMSR